MSNSINVKPTREFKTADFSSIPVSQAKIDNIVDHMMMAGGVKTLADMINYEAAAKAGLVSFEAAKKAKSIKNVNFGSSTVDFNQNGGILIDGFNTTFYKVIRESYGLDEGGKTYMDNVFPDSNIPSQKVVVEVYAAPGGTLDSYAYGQPAYEKTKIGNRSYEYEGAPYRNYLKMQENDLTFLRQLGEPDTSARGVMQRLTMYSLQAKILTSNRKALLKNTIFNNGVTINGQAINYQIPSYNIVGSVTAPSGQWGTYNTTTGAITINSNANPINDLYYYLQSYAPWLSRFEMLRRCKIVMSPITQQFITNNPNVRSQILAVQSAPGSQFNPRGQYNADFAVKTLIPFFEGTVEVDGSAYLLNNSDITWQPDGSGFTSTPVGQQYFIPPGAILFHIDTEEFGGPLGEFIYTSAVQNGGFVNANPGPWFIIEDCTAPGTRGGPLNPFINLDFGFAGGLAPYRPESTFIGQFVTITS